MHLFLDLYLAGICRPHATQALGPSASRIVEPSVSESSRTHDFFASGLVKVVITGDPMNSGWRPCDD